VLGTPTTIPTKHLTVDALPLILKARGNPNCK
jgi:hypothetical protein